MPQAPGESNTETGNEISGAAKDADMDRPPLPFRSTTIDHVRCGKHHCEPQKRHLGGTDLSLLHEIADYDGDGLADMKIMSADYQRFRIMRIMTVGYKNCGKQ